ncbi:MAG: RagB/SusD family nutrient uptake outer membrane protein, partial [Tannerella sp.]|nr:RagB/SusD family nutrient uptake outer membrane protein [Tannerella sp.]
MKKIIYLIAIVFLLPVLSGCEDFLDTQSYTAKNSETFPRTEEDANQMLTGVYAVMNLITNNDYGSSYLLTAELASDDRMGGGGSNDKQWTSINHLLYTDPTHYRDFWAHHYQGISRATAAITALETMEEGDLKNQKLGEARVLRAFYYFELVQLLGDVPLMKAAPDNVGQALESPAQASQEEIFTQIGTDLWEAYSAMPTVKWNTYPSGTITKWAAAGLLARAWLFYTGFYQKSSMPIDGGEVTSDQVAAALKDCMDNSGHTLISDFRSLWTYTNSVTKPDYPFAADAPTWILDGQNSEHIFVVKNIGLNNWDGTKLRFSNWFAVAFAIRNGGVDNRYQSVFPLGEGWGAGPVNSRLWDQWATDEPNDPRRKASIYNVEEEGSGYEYGGDTQMEETGLWQKKIVATRAYGKGGNPTALYSSFFSAPAYEGYSGDDFQVGNAADLLLLRYADILLMHSEVTKTPEGMNQVRARVGLPAVAYSDEALRKERRHELAFEGLRWGDIRRWGIAEQVLNDMYNIPIYSSGVLTTMKPQGGAGDVAARYRATKGFFMIPQNEIDLANGALKQNAGWEGTEALFS